MFQWLCWLVNGEEWLMVMFDSLDAQIIAGNGLLDTGVRFTVVDDKDMNESCELTSRISKAEFECDNHLLMATDAYQPPTAISGKE